MWTGNLTHFEADFLCTMPGRNRFPATTTDHDDIACSQGRGEFYLPLCKETSKHTPLISALIADLDKHAVDVIGSFIHTAKLGRQPSAAKRL